MQRILAAIDELHYVPNMSARALVSHSSRIIAYVDTHSPQETYAGNGFAGVMLSGLESVVTDHGYFLMTRRGTDEDVLRLMLNNWNPDGVIFKDRVPQSLVDFVKKQGKPCVTINTYLDDRRSFRCAPRIAGAAIWPQSTSSIWATEIFCSSAPVHCGFMNNDQRYAGYCDALEEAGIAPNPDNLMTNLFPFNAERGIALGRQLAARRDFTGICVSGDQYAAAVITGLREGGARVPEDVSIVGFDDVDIARMTFPPLTTHPSGWHRQGSPRGRKRFSPSIDGENPDPKDFNLPVELVVRGTTAKAK